eukprot:TRINITY_DN17057_c0_g1_i1.p1 TRINITY_DN17057_c0_g1~~TRINITY_DN17057_c0_g1_i1.p1  ORF type:complete len:261 (-),score=29.40 TRINITY_DN17057_c0_g1_i1:184-966(-)
MKATAIVSFLSTALLAQSASWVTVKNYQGTSVCSTSSDGEIEVAETDADFPMLLETCVQGYRGSPDRSKWKWTKATCNANTVVRTSYKDEKCTVVSDDSVLNYSTGCTNSSSSSSRNISCTSQFEVVQAKSYMVPPGSDASKCVDGTHVTDKVFALGACQPQYSFSDGGMVGLKAHCIDGKLVMKKYTDAIGCSDAGSDFFNVTTSCAPGDPGYHGFLALKSECGDSKTTPDDGGSTSTSISTRLGLGTLLIAACSSAAM